MAPLIRRFAARALCGAAESEDAAQVALMKLFANASDFDRERDALAWVLGIVAFECRTFRKRDRRRRENLGHDSLELPAETPDPEQLAILRDLEAAAREVLGTLRPLDAETLQMAASGERPDLAPATFRKRLGAGPLPLPRGMELQAWSRMKARSAGPTSSAACATPHA